MQFSLEPEHPRPILDHVLPFFGLQDTTCQVNQYILPLRTSLQFTIGSSLEACQERWIPWDEDLNSTFRYHMLITEPVLYGRMSEYALRHNHAVQMSSSTDPQMNQVVHSELHL